MTSPAWAPLACADKRLLGFETFCLRPGASRPRSASGRSVSEQKTGSGRPGWLEVLAPAPPSTPTLPYGRCVLLWINGPQGGGKTQTAYELHRRLPGSFVCDPEHVGFGLHGMTPPALRGDFQDLPAWREGVFEILDSALTADAAPLIAPMTIVNPEYFAETVGKLRERGHDVHHFALLARPETVTKRIRRRGDGRVLAAGRRRRHLRLVAGGLLLGAADSAALRTASLD